MQRICVFAGSSAGAKPAYLRGAARFGSELARRGLGLVYGGGARGLMGALADAVLEGGGDVIGVIPRSMVEREWAHPRVTKMQTVGDMHERKALMNQLADAFVALPGGIGTLEELFEVYSWAQLGFHHKRVGILEVEGFYAPLLGCLDRLVDEGFVGRQTRSLLLLETDAGRLLDALLP
ncbi:MAG: TIGR00730 family Rossman fold protein [Myxococcales bacterium]|nr:TIGR00730 family Rossman fold protein [Myxococcales bacterium]